MVSSIAYLYYVFVCFYLAEPGLSFGWHAGPSLQHVVSLSFFSCGVPAFSCSMWNLVP